MIQTSATDDRLYIYYCLWSPSNVVLIAYCEPETFSSRISFSVTELGFVDSRGLRFLCKHFYIFDNIETSLCVILA